MPDEHELDQIRRGNTKDDFKIKAYELSHAFCDALVPSREASLAHTNLEQAMMWAERAIDKYGVGEGHES